MSGETSVTSILETLQINRQELNELNSKVDLILQKPENAPLLDPKHTLRMRPILEKSKALAVEIQTTLFPDAGTRAGNIQYKLEDVIKLRIRYLKDFRKKFPVEPSSAVNTPLATGPHQQTHPFFIQKISRPETFLSTAPVSPRGVDALNVSSQNYNSASRKIIQGEDDGSTTVISPSSVNVAAALGGIPYIDPNLTAAFQDDTFGSSQDITQPAQGLFVNFTTSQTSISPSLAANSRDHTSQPQLNVIGAAIAFPDFSPSPKATSRRTTRILTKGRKRLPSAAGVETTTESPTKKLKLDQASTSTVPDTSLASNIGSLLNNFPTQPPYVPQSLVVTETLLVTRTGTMTQCFTPLALYLNPIQNSNRCHYSSDFNFEEWSKHWKGAMAFDETTERLERNSPSRGTVCVITALDWQRAITELTAYRNQCLHFQIVKFVTPNQPESGIGEYMRPEP